MSHNTKWNVNKLRRCSGKIFRRHHGDFCTSPGEVTFAGISSHSGQLRAVSTAAKPFGNLVNTLREMGDWLAGCLLHKN